MWGNEWGHENSSINCIFLSKLSIKDHPKPYNTEKRRNKAKDAPWDSVRLQFVEKTSIFFTCYLAAIWVTVEGADSLTNVNHCISLNLTRRSPWACMSNTIENFRYITCYSFGTPRTIKTLTQIILSDKLSEDLPLNEKTRNHTEIRKRSHFTMWSSSQLYAIFSEFLNHRNRTNGKVFFCCRPLPNILKYSDHMWDLPITWISRFLRVQLVYMKILT